MSNAFTLDNLRNSVEEKFSPLTITLDDGTVVTLRNLVRLDKASRESARELLDGFADLVNTESSDEAELVADVIKAAGDVIAFVADRDGDRLVAALGDDVHLFIQVLETYLEVTQPGEASNSPG